MDRGMRFFEHKRSGHLVAVLGDQVARLTPYGSSEPDSESHPTPQITPTDSPAQYVVSFAGRRRSILAAPHPGRLARPLGPPWQSVDEIAAIRKLMTGGDPAAGITVAFDWFEKAVGTATRAVDLLNTARPVVRSYAAAAEVFLLGLREITQLRRNKQDDVPEGEA